MWQEDCPRIDSLDCGVTIYLELQFPNFWAGNSENLSVGWKGQLAEIKNCR